MYVNSRAVLPSTAKTLPSRFYADPEHHAREVEAVHLSMWLHAGREEEIPRPGDYFLRQLAGESVIVMRDEDGGVRAFHNVCRHRGTRLCREETGRLPGKLQCPYHAWTYGFDGSLLSAPHMDRSEGFDPACHGLGKVAVEVWEGHLFLHLGEDPIPFEQHLADLPEKLAPWRMGELRVAHRAIYDVAANWKLIVHNYSECLHCPLLHPQLQQLSHFLSGENDPPRPTYLGGRMELRPGVVSLTTDGKSSWDPLPGLGEREKRSVAYYALLPNLLLNLHPDFMVTFTFWPRAHNRTAIVCEWHFHPQTIAGQGFDPAPAVDFWDLTNRQDWQVCEMAQEGISSRAYRQGPYSNREELLYQFDRWVLERTG